MSGARCGSCEASTKLMISNVAGIRDLGGRLDVLIFDQSRENFGLLVFGQSLDGGECLCNRECRMSYCLVPNVLCWR